MDKQALDEKQLPGLMHTCIQSLFTISYKHLAVFDFIIA